MRIQVSGQEQAQAGERFLTQGKASNSGPTQAISPEQHPRFCPGHKRKADKKSQARAGRKFAYIPGLRSRGGPLVPLVLATTHPEADGQKQGLGTVEGRSQGIICWLPCT